MKNNRGKHGNQNANFFSNFLSDDHIELGFYGASTKNDVVSFIASHACNVQSYSVDKFSVKLLDTNIAVLTYRAEQNTVCNHKVPSLSGLVLFTSIEMENRKMFFTSKHKQLISFCLH